MAFQPSYYCYWLFTELGGTSVPAFDAGAFPDEVGPVLKAWKTRKLHYSELSWGAVVLDESADI